MAGERGASGARSGAVEAKSTVRRPFCSRKGVFRHRYARKRAEYTLVLNSMLGEALSVIVPVFAPQLIRLFNLYIINYI